jgi:surface polysaccharide O-acyltransferase-like enzyme
MLKYISVYKNDWEKEKNMKSQTEKHANASFIIFLRIIAAVAVVMIHTKTLTNFETKGYYLLHSCILWCVPIFFMISGYIFLGLKTNITYNNLKNI